MKGLCKVMLVGRLGADPELKTSAGGNVKFTTIRVATNWARRNGEEWIEETEWHRVKVFGNKAERCMRLLRKGSVIAVEGSLRYRRWEDAEGKPHFFTDIVADRIDFVADLASREVRSPVAPAESVEVEAVF